MNANSGLQGSVSLDPSCIDSDLIEFLQNKISDDIHSNVAEESYPSPQFRQLAGENIGRAAYFQRVVSYDLLRLMKFWPDVACEHQISAHVGYGKHVQRFRRQAF